MNQNKIAISSLALDLKRVATLYFAGSEKSAQRFSEEALKRTAEIDRDKIPQYINEALNKVKVVLNKKAKLEKAEDALMYSTIFQNYVLKS